MRLRTRVEGGGTPRLTRWGVDSEYGRLRDVLVGPIDHFEWQPGNAVAQRSERVGLVFEWLRSRGIRAIPISYGDAMQLGSNVVALGNERVLVPASSKKLIAACRAEGLRVYDPDVSMIGNGGGAVHCMCQALKRDSADGR